MEKSGKAYVLNKTNEARKTANKKEGSNRFHYHQAFTLTTG